MRHQLVECDCCGKTYRQKHWINMKGRRMLVIPVLFRKLGSAWFDVCSIECEEVFRAFSVWHYNADIYEYNQFMEMGDEYLKDKRQSAPSVAIR